MKKFIGLELLRMVALFSSSLLLGEKLEQQDYIMSTVAVISCLYTIVQGHYNRKILEGVLLDKNKIQENK